MSGRRTSANNDISSATSAPWMHAAMNEALLPDAGCAQGLHLYPTSDAR
jgi:hypothetical protein